MLFFFKVEANTNMVKFIQKKRTWTKFQIVK